MDSLGQLNAMSILKNGGPLMIPLLLCSIFAIGIILEKLIYFSSIKIDIQQFKTNVFEQIKNNKINAALDICDQYQSPVAKIFKAGIIKFGAGRAEIKEHIEDSSLFEIPKLESRLGALATIAQVCPLIGLLGTVIGIISCFYTIQVKTAAFSPITPGDMSGGIAQALITTAAGLLIAIPAHVAYNYFVHRINHITTEMERAATELVNFMGQLHETSVNQI